MNILKIFLTGCFAFILTFNTDIALANGKKKKSPTSTQQSGAGSNCNHKLSDWELKQNNIDAHALKYEVKGRRANISLFDLCKCPDKSVVVRERNCRGAAEYTGVFVR